MRKIIDLINEYDIITIFRHEFPDPDALGSQTGLKEIIEENFANKKVYLVGKHNETFSENLFDLEDNIDETIIKDSLAIVLDTANEGRVDDGSFKKAKYILKIDHHPPVDQFGDYNYIDVKACATSFLIAKLAYNYNLVVNERAATALYAGIVGDTNRFFHNVRSSVFKMSEQLMESNANPTLVYNEMYAKSLEDLKITAFILDHYKVIKRKLAYYILEEEDYNACHVSFEKAKEFIHVLSGVKEFEIWVSCTYNAESGFYHVSIRSKSIIINDVAKLYGGGGHEHAAGVKVSTLERFHLILHDLEKKLD